MTVIAYAGSEVAIDKMSVSLNLKYPTSKWWIDDGDLLTGAGAWEETQRLMRWYCEGCTPNSFPYPGDKDYSGSLVVFRKDGTIHQFELSACGESLSNASPWAWGSGRELALGAMAAGARASDAVRIASKYSTTCGIGIERFEFWPDGWRHLGTEML